MLEALCLISGTISGPPVIFIKMRTHDFGREMCSSMFVRQLHE